METKPDSVKICWDKPKKKVDYFRIRYQQRDNKSKWKFTETNDDSNNTTIIGLMPDTVHVFQVQGVFDDIDGQYGPISDDITTLVSPSAEMLKMSNYIEGQNPKIYRIPMKENNNASNNTARTKQLISGKKQLVRYSVEKRKT